MLLKAKADNPNATFYEGDALQLADVLSEEAPFAGVYCLGNSLGYFDAEGMTRFLEGISQKLQAGGLLVLHSDMVAEVLLPHWEAHMEVIANGVYAIADNEDYDLQNSRLITRFSFEKEDEETGKISKESHLIQHYIYTVGEISRMLSQSGCRLLSAYGDVKGKPFVIGDAHWYGVFQKN